MSETKNIKDIKKKKDNNEELLLLVEKLKVAEEETLRAKADLINYRKRKDEEVANLLKYANAELFMELLPVMDNFERAIIANENNPSEELNKFLDGFKIIYTNMKQLLEINGVKEIDCLGKKFDANYETSVFTDNNLEYEDDVVLEVLQKGYTYNDKLLRSASVKINKLEDVYHDG